MISNPPTDPEWILTVHVYDNDTIDEIASAFRLIEPEEVSVCVYDQVIKLMIFELDVLEILKYG